MMRTLPSRADSGREATARNRCAALRRKHVANLEDPPAVTAETVRSVTDCANKLFDEHPLPSTGCGPEIPVAVSGKCAQKDHLRLQALKTPERNHHVDPDKRQPTTIAVHSTGGWPRAHGPTEAPG